VGPTPDDGDRTLRVRIELDAPHVGATRRIDQPQFTPTFNTDVDDRT
jgi:hypothetical protein